ncbi:translation elongation factor Ts [Rickettsiales bacterium]|nr:translation elongation factor Ts [Rickettsiales bacterium]
MSSNVELVKQLREETSLGMMKCKKALEETNYDYQKALVLLREKGQSVANSKSGRKTSHGLVGIINDVNGASAIKLCCETDFVARGDAFIELTENLLKQANTSMFDSVDALLDSDSGSVKSSIVDSIAKIGENIELKDLKQAKGSSAYYVHNVTPSNPNLGQIVTAITYEAENDNENVKEAMRKVAMHLAATKAEYINIADVSADVVEEEKRIYSEQAKSSGKPEHVIEKMVSGRINKFYQENVLMEQDFIIDPDLKVREFIAKVEKENDTKITVKGTFFMSLSN